MADISSEITAISSARYGEEVRGAIVSALTAVNDQVEDDTESAAASAADAAESLEACQGIESDLSSAVSAAEQTEADIEAAEALRVTAENGRVAAENARAAAETAREAQETGYVAQAQAAAQLAQTYASSDYVKTAQSWAIGGTSSRYGEDTNNAKYWSEVAAQVVTEGGVGSFNGRTGQVVPVDGDYDTSMITRGTGSAESALTAIETGIGTTTLPTTAQTITGAIAEHETDITSLNSNLTYTNNKTFHAYNYTESASATFTVPTTPANGATYLVLVKYYLSSTTFVTDLILVAFTGATSATPVWVAHNSTRNLPSVSVSGTTVSLAFSSALYAAYYVMKCF